MWVKNFQKVYHNNYPVFLEYLCAFSHHYWPFTNWRVFPSHMLTAVSGNTLTVMISWQLILMYFYHRQVPVVTANIPVDHSCQYKEGSFPHFSGLADSVMYVACHTFSYFYELRVWWKRTSLINCIVCRVMNGINAPKVIECFGSDGRKYRQLAKSGNDDLRQDAVWLWNLFLYIF